MTSAITKMCSLCALEKPLASFSPDPRGAQGRHSWCAECASLKSRERYPQEKGWRQKQDTLRNRQRKLDAIALKGGVCSDCQMDLTEHWECADFDHRPGTVKLAVPSNLRRRHHAAMYLTELEKCDLVCANCHRKRTRSRYAY